MKKLRLFITTMLVLLFGGLSLSALAQQMIEVPTQNYAERSLIIIKVLRSQCFSKEVLSYSGTLNGDTVTVTGTQASMILGWMINSTTPPATYIEANGDTIILFFGIKNVTLNTILGSQYISHVTVPGDSVNTGITFTITGLTPGYDYEVTPALILVQSGNQVWFMEGNPIYFTTDCNSSAINIAGGTTEVCAGTSVPLTASGATTYVWNTGETTASIIVTPMITTTYTVTGTTGGCTAIGTQTVSVVAGFSPAISDDDTICSGSSVQLLASGGTTYSWSPSTGLSATNIANPICSTTSTRTYTCLISNGTCSTSLTVTITVGATISVSITGDANVCAGGPSTLTAYSSTAISYIWSTGGITAVITVSPTVTTTYTVTVSNGICTKTDDFTVIVEPLAIMQSITNGSICILEGTGLANLSNMKIYPSGSTYYPYFKNDTIAKFINVVLECDDDIVLTTTGGCQSNFSYTCVGISELEGKDLIKVYPNPFKDVLNIELPDGNGKYKIILYDILGQKVQELSAEKSFQILRNSLPKGIYILNISSEGMTETFKIQTE